MAFAHWLTLLLVLVLLLDERWLILPVAASRNVAKQPPLLLQALFDKQQQEQQGRVKQQPVIPLTSTKQSIHEHHRRLTRQNRTRELFQLEEELLQLEAVRHLSRYERQYRMEHGLDLEIDSWTGLCNDTMTTSTRNKVLRRRPFFLDKNLTSSETSSTQQHDPRTWRRYGQRWLLQKRHKRQRQLEATSSSPSDSKTISSSASTTTLQSGKFDNYQAIPLSQGYGTHIANVWVGSPQPQRKTVIVDTGSHYTAFPCKGCRNCGRSHHTDPYFDATKSDTYRELQCDECAGGVMCQNGQCRFSQAYTEGSSWDALQVKDMVYCGGNDVLDSVDPQHSKYAIEFMFGCMTKMSGLFLTQLADGIMGLSAHQATLPKQLWDKGLLEHNLFAMCFRRELGTSKRGVSAGSMTLGGVSTNLDTGPVVYAKNMARAGWFTVFVKNIYIRAGGGQSALASSPAGKRQTVRVRINPRTVNSGKGVIVDSGTTDTYLSKSAAPAFKKAWMEATGGKAYSHSSVSLTDEELRSLPTVLVQCHAYGNAQDPSVGDYNDIPGYAGDLDPTSPHDLLIAIPATSYMDYSPSTKMYTSRLYFTETAGGVLGSNTMQGHNVVFDWEHSRIGFAESSCSYDQSTVPAVAEDAGYASDCQVQEPVLSRPCLDTLNRYLCQFNQSNIALIGNETWSAVVKSPGTRLGMTCVDAAQSMQVKDQYKDPFVTCNSRGTCQEERPCQMTCPQVDKAAQIVPSPAKSKRLNCGDSQWSACDKACFQTRVYSEAYSDGKCHEVSRQTRPCHIHACARDDPCRAPYAVRLVLGLKGVELKQWSLLAEETLALSVATMLGRFKLNVLPGDVNVRMARAWYLDEDNPDAAAAAAGLRDDTSISSSSTTRPAVGVKAIVDVAVANNRSVTNTSSLEDDSDFEDHWKLLGNLSKHLVMGRPLREVRCFDEDLFVLAQEALAIKTTALEHDAFRAGLVELLKKGLPDDDSAPTTTTKEENLFASVRGIGESIIISAWSFRNGVDDKVNYLGPRKPWWFGIFRAIHFTTVLVTTSLVLWSLFGVLQNVYENGIEYSSSTFCFDLHRWRIMWFSSAAASSSSSTSSSSRARDSNTDLASCNNEEEDGADEGVSLLVPKGREIHRHGSTSPKKRRNNSSCRLTESQSL